MARHRASYEHPGDDDVNEIIGNGSLSEHYLALARDLDVMEAKVYSIDPRKLLQDPPPPPHTFRYNSSWDQQSLLFFPILFFTEGGPGTLV